MILFGFITLFYFLPHLPHKNKHLQHIYIHLYARDNEKLNLYKANPTTNGNDTFTIKTMLNDNLDIIDQVQPMTL